MYMYIYMERENKLSKKLFTAPFVLTFRFLIFYLIVTVLTLPQFVWILKPYSSCCLLFWVLDSCLCFPAISTVLFCVSFPSIAPSAKPHRHALRSASTHWVASRNMGTATQDLIVVWSAQFQNHQSNSRGKLWFNQHFKNKTAKWMSFRPNHGDGWLVHSPVGWAKVRVPLSCQLSDQLTLPLPNFSKPSCQFIGKKKPMYAQVWFH